MSLEDRRKKFPELSRAPLSKFFVLGHWEIVVKDVEFAKQIYTNPGRETIESMNDSLLANTEAFFISYYQKSSPSS